MDQLTWDYILKYVIVGDAAVGKSCLLVRLTDDKFANAEPTLGVEFGSKILTVGDEGKRVKVQCWDTAGTESFRSITRSYFRGAAGALLVYDVTRRETFEHVTSWLDDLRTHAEENCSIILVANKTDLCSSVPTALPQIQFGEAVSPLDSEPESTSDPSSSDGLPTNGPGEGGGQGGEGGGQGGEGGQGGKKLLPRAVSTLEGAFFAKQHGLLYVETSAKEGWGVVDAFEWTARQMLERIEEGKFDRRQKGVELNKTAAKGGCC